jgi:membrane associated rhomboid family serine protease
MSRYAPPSTLSYSFGPGPITPAVKWIIIANAAVFVVTFFFAEPVFQYFGLIPKLVFEKGWIWQLGTYMFLHANPMHILLNMLGVWMFGVTLERRWGTTFFSKYYAITGLGAGLTAVLVSLLPFEATRPAYDSATIGASGALFGLLVAFAIYYPHQPILLMMLFPIPARIFVMIFGGLALLYTIQGGRGVSDTAHLGGLVTGYLYLKNGRGGMLAEVKYRYLKWKMNRLRRKFDVYSGGRSDWDRNVH